MIIRPVDLRRWAALLLAAALAALGLLVVQPRPAAAAAVRIMPLGDSITGSPGCWRALLWNRLQSNGFTDIDFVGTLGPQGCGVAYDGDNEGHGGILATNMASQNQLPPWLAATRPDIVLMHLGTNDVWNNRSAQTILDAFSTLLSQMRASNPNVKLIVARIIPMNPSNCGECGARVVALNNALPGWASARSTAQSPITVVDQWTGFNTATDTGDGVHPNNAGIQKMSDRWYPAVTQALNGTTASASSSSSSRPASSSSSSSRPASSSSSPTTGGRSCSATFRVIGSPWPDGYQGEVTVANTGTLATNGWATPITLGSGQQLRQWWNAARNGTENILRNVDHNRVIQPGGSTTYGFIASRSGGTAPAATLACTAS
jgi:lysophospholipase L1-like esterase